jgi:hypothetical protein
MSDMKNSQSGLDAYWQARALAEQALHAQAKQRTEEADRLFAEALSLDPAAVAEILQAHDAVHEPDARDRRAADHAVDDVIRRDGDGTAEFFDPAMLPEAHPS